MSFSAYDNLAVAAYIVELDTYRVIYINKVGKKLLSDITGKVCYEVLNNSCNKCSSCKTVSEIQNGDGCHIKARYLDGPKKIVDVYESIIELSDGQLARLCVAIDVTEQENIKIQKQLQQQLKDKMQDMIDIQSCFIKSAKSMMTASTLKGELIFVNDSMANTLGYAHEEIIKMQISDFHTPEVALKFKQNYIPTAINDGIWKGDSTILKKDKSVLPVRIMIFPIYNKQNKIIATAAIMEDISLTLNLENAHRYNMAIIDGDVNYIGMSDLNGNILYHNKGAYKMLGYDENQDKLWTRESMHTKAYIDKINSVGIPTALKEGIWKSRGEAVTKNGKVIPIDQTIFTVFDEDKNIMGLATIIRDISADIEWEKGLAKTQNTLRAIIDTVPSSIFWKDQNSCFLGANRQFALDAGVNDEAQLIGKSDYDFYPKDIADTYIEADKKLFETGEEILHHEEPFKGADGQLRYVSTSKVLVKDKDGHPFALLGIYDDITKIKQNEIKLEAAIKLAEEASRAKSDFLSRMSHEIRTPMNAIIGMTKIGQASIDLERMQYCFEKIDGASKHLLGLINDILDMSKIEANKLELVEEPFNFEKMLENICNVINVKAEEKKQFLQIEIADNIPAEIVADEMRISQVIINLLSNAIKFTPEKNEIKFYASCEKLAENDKIRLKISVTDTGIGLSQQQISKLFNSFEQAEAVTSRKYGGTGLGLSICKKIVEMMGGQINVESQLGKGSQFSFSIIVKTTNKKGSRVLYNASCYKNMHILVVDDDSRIGDYFAKLFNSYSIAFDFALNGEDALRLVEESLKNGKRYNIMFVDYLMQDMDGLEVSRQVKKLVKDINIVMFSSAEWSQIEDTAYKAGVDKFISKPLFSSPILDCINQLALYIDSNHCVKTESKAADKNNNKDIFKGYTVLLAEDIKINREIVTTLLEDTQIKIDCAENGIQAVEMVVKNPDYDAILMDIQMPDMDGLSATRAIKELKIEKAKSIPIIAMTANAFAEDIETCKKAGMIDHIGKPIDIDILIQKLKRYLQKD